MVMQRIEEAPCHLLDLPAEIFIQIIQQVHRNFAATWDYRFGPWYQALAELRLVNRAFEDVVSREVFPRERKNWFSDNVRAISPETAKWLLVTRARLNWRQTRSNLAFLHRCAAYATAHQAMWMPKTTDDDDENGGGWPYQSWLDAACQAVVAHHGPQAVVSQLVFPATGGGRKGVLGTYLRMLRARKGSLRASMTEVERHGVAQMAAALGDSRAVEAIMTNCGVDPDANHPVLGVAVFVAASRGRVSTVDGLAAKGADLNVRGHLLPPPPRTHDKKKEGDPERNDTPLLAALERGHRHVANLLAAHPRVNVGETGRSRKGVLVLAAERGWADTVQVLLARGDIDVDERTGAAGDLPIIAAVRHGTPDVLALLLETTRFGLTSSHYAGHCPIVLALSRGSPAMVRLLLDTGQVGPNDVLACSKPLPSSSPRSAFVTDSLYTAWPSPCARGTPMAIAVTKGHAALVEALLCYPGVDPNLAPDSHTPLAMAVERDAADVVEVLLRYSDRIAPSLAALGRPLLHTAAARGSVGVVGMLLECGGNILDGCGIDPNARDERGETALCTAIWHGQWSVVERLVRCPAVDVNLLGRGEGEGEGEDRTPGPGTPLQMAALQRNYSAVGYLMRRPDLDVNASGRFGTALSIAVETSNQWAMKTLLYDAGVDVNRTSTAFAGPVCVHRKMPSSSSSSSSCSSSSWGFFEAEGIYGLDSPLSRAVKGDRLDAVQALLENHRIDPNVADSCGRPPLWWASRGGDAAMVSALLASRIPPDVNARDIEGWSALLCAANGNREAVARLLLATPGVDPNLPNAHGWTALHVCVDAGHAGILRRLLDHPATDVWARTASGETALDLAGETQMGAALRWEMGRLVDMMAARPDSWRATVESENVFMSDDCIQ